MKTHMKYLWEESKKNECHQFKNSKAGMEKDLSAKNTLRTLLVVRMIWKQLSWKYQTRERIGL